MGRGSRAHRHKGRGAVALLLALTLPQARAAGALESLTLALRGALFPPAPLQPSLVSTIALTLLSLSPVLLLLLWGLPRWRSQVAVAASAACVVAVMGLAWAAAATQRWLPWALPLTALVLGHAVWLVRRRQPATSASLLLPDTVGAPVGSAEKRTLGRYQIEQEIGRGAMGAVYLARDLKTGRPVAIKTMALMREFAGDELLEARARFFREAETAGRLQHPDIVTILDAGEAHGLAYIAMEHLKGDNLEAFTQPGRLLPVPTVLLVVARVAEALGHAHSQGVVHRDVKPANVMVDLESDQVKVTDFGIARVADTQRTQTGMVLGTPSFMSPEQLAGRRLDGRSDLYSLGVMLFQLLTGQLPHRSDSMAELMKQIANDAAPDVLQLRPELPDALARVVATTLDKRPEARYSSGAQLAADLRSVARRMQASGLQPAAPLASGPPDSSGFAATVKMDRAEPRHNSGS